MRKEVFANGEFYHIYNRGVDKRDVFMDKNDFERFLQSIKEFNVIDPIGSIYENSFVQNTYFDSKRKHKPLVNFVAYCLNSNHYHFILQQVAEKGVEKFMQRLGTGYTKYFNNKHRRSGILFQGVFKAKHIDTNEYLLHLSAYVNLNNRVHQLGSEASKSSWDEYIGKQISFCKKEIIMEQFKNIAEYKDFSESSLKDILNRKQLAEELKNLLLE